MADIKVNPLVLSSAVVGGIAGVAAAQAKPVVSKIANSVKGDIYIPPFDIPDNSLQGLKYKFKHYFINTLYDIEKTIRTGFNLVKTFVLDSVKKFKVPETASKSTAKAAKLLKAPAILAGIAAGALYTGYKIISSQREDV